MAHVKLDKLRGHPYSLESYNGVGNDKRERGIAKAHTIKISRIGQPRMEVPQTQRHSLTGRRSETITQLRMYSPLPFKYCESKGIKDLGYSRVNGRTMYADHKLAEFKDRVSM